MHDGEMAIHPSGAMSASDRLPHLAAQQLRKRHLATGCPNPRHLFPREATRRRLEREPQVAIVRNLLAQAPRALLVPESVSVDVVMMDAGAEFAAAGSGDEAAMQQAIGDRIELGTVFELSAEVARAWPAEDGGRLKGGSVQIPSPRDERLSPMLLTRIRVFGGHLLADYTSGLTSPRILPIDDRLDGGDTLNFTYRLGPSPGLECEVIRT